MSERILEVTGLTKTYASGSKSLTVLNDITFFVEKGQSVSIVGPSGSGKTTLLGLCAGLDRASAGMVVLAGTPLADLDEDARAKLRNEKVGFVFQTFQLIPTLTALENVMIPLELRGKRGIEQRAADLLDSVGLSDRLHHYPAQLSGGEQQRVALARAFVNEPDVLFADEPTGNLDADTGNHIESLLFDLNRQAGTTLILVTHDLDLADRTERIVKLKGGSLVADYATQSGSVV